MEPEAAPMYGNCYAFPRLIGAMDLGLIRLGGAGLGNHLFTWARCLIQARRYGLKRIGATWPQFKREPWMHHELDKRTYHDLFCRAQDEVEPLHRLRLLATKRRVPESQLGKEIPDGSIVVFEGFDGYLQPILAHRDLVRSELIAMVRDKHKGAIQAGFSPDIAIHVRLGDFLNADPVRGNSKLDIGWYAGILKGIREQLGPLQAVIFSDGRDEEIAPLLAMEGVKRVSFGSSIADILAMSQARILITSGSTFSMWSSFLGQMPTVWFPKRLYHPILPDPRRELSTYAEIPRTFVEQCELSLASGNARESA